MKDTLRYFFGKGDTVEFENFTLAHFLPILAAVTALFVLVYLPWFIKDKKAKKENFTNIAKENAVCNW